MLKFCVMVIGFMLSAATLGASEKDFAEFTPLALSYAWDNPQDAPFTGRFPEHLVWQTLKGQRVAHGYHQQTLWIEVKADTRIHILEHQVLDIGSNSADEVILYQRRGDALVEISRTGDDQPFHERLYPHRNLMFSLEELNTQNPLVLRLRTTSAHNYWIRLLPESVIWHEAEIEDVLYGTSMGIIFIMLCYNLFLFILQKNRSHLYYTLYAGSYIFLVLAYKGYGFQYIWPSLPLLQKYATGLGIHLTVLAFMLFARSFFVRDVDRPLFKWADAGIAMTLVSMVMLLATMNQPYWKTYGMSGLTAFAFLSYLVVIRHVWKHPDRSLCLALSAVFCLHVGSITAMLSAVGALPYNWATSNAMILGGNVEMTLLAFMLAERFHAALREQTRSELALRGAVDDDLAEKLKSNPQLLREDASERELTVLFLDIVNSSSTSQMFPGRELYDKMRMTLNEITRIIRAHQGVVNRSLGDGVICYFGANWDGDADADHPTQALLAAIALQQHFLKECLDPGQRILLPVRIGLHTGRMYLGSIGDQQRVDFTLFGYQVNIAKRLEDASNPFRILLSLATYERLNRNLIADAFHPIRIAIKNQSELMPAYEFNPFATDAARLAEVRHRLWHYFNFQMKDERHSLRKGTVWMDCEGERFEVVNISNQGLCIVGPSYLARGVHVQLSVVGNRSLLEGMEAFYLVPMQGSVRWSHPQDGHYRHGVRLVALHPEQLAAWLRLFQPYVLDAANPDVA